MVSEAQSETERHRHCAEVGELTGGSEELGKHLLQGLVTEEVGVLGEQQRRCVHAHGCALFMRRLLPELVQVVLVPLEKRRKM